MISSTVVPMGYGQGTSWQGGYYNLPATSGSYISPPAAPGWQGNYIGQPPASYAVGNYIPPATVSNIIGNYVPPASGLSLHGAEQDVAPSPDREATSLVGSAVSGVASGLSSIVTGIFGSSQPDIAEDDVESLKVRVQYLEQKLINSQKPPPAGTYSLPSYTSGTYQLSPRANILTSPNSSVNTQSMTYSYTKPPMVGSASSQSLLASPTGNNSPRHSLRFSPLASYSSNLNGNTSPVIPSVTLVSSHMQWNPPKIEDNKPLMVSSASSPSLLAVNTGYISPCHSPRFPPTSSSGIASPAVPSTKYSMQWNPPTSLSGNASPVVPSTQYSMQWNPPTNLSGNASPSIPEYCVQWNPPELESESCAKLPEQASEPQATSAPNEDDFDARVRSIIKEVLKDKKVLVVPPDEPEAKVERLPSGRSGRTERLSSGSSRAPSPHSKSQSPKKRSMSNLSAKEIA